MEYDEEESARYRTNGLTVEIVPKYYRDMVVNEEIGVNLNYVLSDYKNKKDMLKKILKDLNRLTNIIENTLLKEEE